MTEEQIINAILARINHRYDHPDLIQFGPMSDSMIEDLEFIITLGGMKLE